MRDSLLLTAVVIGLLIGTLWVLGSVSRDLWHIITAGLAVAGG